MTQGVDAPRKFGKPLICMLKSFMKSQLAASLLSMLIAAYLDLVRRTSKITIVDRGHYDDALAEKRGVILAFWHGRLMMAPFVRDETDAKVYMLVSQHRDGEIITKGTRKFGVSFIRGSAANPSKPDKSKHGASAVAQIVGALKAGDVVGITPDGPRGPRNKVQRGIVKIAQYSGAPIIPVGASTTRGKFFKSWDCFLAALPFSRLIYVVGPPIRVAPELDENSMAVTRQSIEDAIIAETMRADKNAGQEIRERSSRE